MIWTWTRLLRARDVMAEVTDDVRAAAEAATDAAVTARTQSWHLEEALWSGGRPRASQLRLPRPAEGDGA